MNKVDSNPKYKGNTEQKSGDDSITEDEKEEENKGMLEAIISRFLTK